MLHRVIVGSVLLTLLGCRAPIEPWHEEIGYRWRTLQRTSGGEPGFTVMSPSRTGITTQNDISDDALAANRFLLNGSGVALGDVDGDGWVDVYLARIAAPNVLYRNLGDWRFDDVTGVAGVAGDDRATTGTALVDYDGDGDLDLFITALDRGTALYVNDGSGTFREKTDAGLIAEGAGHTMAFADIDGDGDLDLYVTNYKQMAGGDLFSPAERAFNQLIQEENDEFSIAPALRSHYRLVRQPNRMSAVELAEPDILYVNNGLGGFEAASFTGGRFRDEEGQPLTEAPRDWGLAAGFQDIDGDGDPDLYVANDFESVDRLWLNDGTGRFQLAPRMALRVTSHSSMAVAFADADRDGDVDFFVADMLSRDRRRRRTQEPPTSPDVPTIGVIDDRPQRPRNTLFVNRGDGTFAEIANAAGLAASGWSWGSLFLDVDLDGYDDLLVGNGNRFDLLDGATQRTPIGFGSWQRAILRFPPLSLANAAFRNRGDLTFEDVSVKWGFGVEEDITHGLAPADLDHDGDLDLVLNRLNAPARLLRNDATGNRIAIRVRGRFPNTQGVGAVLRIQDGEGTQRKEVTAGGLYLSSGEPLYSFGVGDASAVTLTIEWPDGNQTVIDNLLPNREYEIVEPSPSNAVGGGPSVAATPTLFRDTSADIKFLHVERGYPEFARQPLLSSGLSRLGPGITWYDADHDGDPDLLIPSGVGGRLSYYRNEGSTFTGFPLLVDPSPLDQTTVLPLPGSAQRISLLVGQMNYESSTQGAARQAASVLQINASVSAFRSAQFRPLRATDAVPGTPSSTGPLAMADYDGDGDLDLFVGGRVLPARYPIAATSRLFANDGGTLTGDAAANRVLQSLGLVSDALWTDVDADGDPDLVLALEWGPIRLLRNDGGVLEDVTDNWNLGAYRGRWNGVTAGDLDGDGRMDLVATNWGRNTALQMSEARPLRVFFADFDNNGTLDVVEAQLDQRIGDFAPLSGLATLTAAMPFLKRNVQSYAVFADAGVRGVIGAPLSNASTLDVTVSDHTLFLNRGDRFEAVALPFEAQLAPSFGATIADFDGDGNEDVFLAQNFFATRPDRGRHAAGLGLVLLGDGTGRLRPLSSAASGVRAFGDQRGAAVADYDGDGRIDLAVTQNAGTTVLLRNQTAAPGVRVRLIGDESNPDAIGAVVRLRYADGLGPAREIRAGGGYWSHDDVVQVFGRRADPEGLWIRWPDGTITEPDIDPSALDVSVAIDGTVREQR